MLYKASPVDLDMWGTINDRATDRTGREPNAYHYKSYKVVPDAADLHRVHCNNSKVRVLCPGIGYKLQCLVRCTAHRSACACRHSSDSFQLRQRQQIFQAKLLLRLQVPSPDCGEILFLEEWQESNLDFHGTLVDV